MPNWTWHLLGHRNWLKNEPVAPIRCKGDSCWELLGKEFSHSQERVSERNDFLPLDAGNTDVTFGTATMREASLRVQVTERGKPSPGNHRKMDPE